jgi:hypothetical protein
MNLLNTNGLTLGFFAFLVVLLTGFWLLKTGKPYRTGIFNFHKLIALAASFLILYNLYQNGSGRDVGFIPVWLILSLGGFLIVLLFGSGAMLSIGKPDPRAVVIGHRIGAGFSAAAVLALIYMKLTGLL